MDNTTNLIVFTIKKIWSKNTYSTSMSLDDKDCQTIIVNKNISTDYHVLTLKQVDFTLSETVCRWKVTPKMYSTYIQMTEGVYIIDNKGKKYDMISYDGISMTPQQDIILGIRTIDFTVTFPTVDTEATSITYYSVPSFQIKDIPVVKNKMPSFENTAQ